MQEYETSDQWKTNAYVTMGDYYHNECNGIAQTKNHNENARERITIEKAMPSVSSTDT